jgi:hypothetical protein
MKLMSQMSSSALLVAISLGVVFAGSALGIAHPENFDRYFGPLPAPLVLVVVGALAFVGLRIVEPRTGFAVWRGERAQSLCYAALTTLPFAVVVILADCFVSRFPRDLNVPWPQSLLFYPVIGFVVEVLFHALPIALAVGASRLVTAPKNMSLLWGGIVVAALAEPLLQVSIELSRAPFSARAAFVGVQVLAFNLLELHLFRRFGFIPMYAARLAYYLAWHVAWGELRLKLLF